MLLLMYSVHDSVSGVYDRPFVARAEGDAVRSFGDIANDKEHPIGKHPEHFSLFHVGTWNDNSGKVDPTPPTHVVSAIDLVNYDRPSDHPGLHDGGNGVSLGDFAAGHGAPPQPKNNLKDEDKGHDPRNYGGTE